MTARAEPGAGARAGAGAEAGAVPAAAPLPGVSDVATRIAAGAAALACGAWIPIVAGITPALVVGLVLLPVWLPVVRRSRPGRWFVGLGVLALLSGVLLTELSAPERMLSSLALRDGLITLSALVLGAGVLLWCRAVLETSTVAVLFGVGALAAAVLRTGGADNPWKYTFGMPVTVLVLALCLSTRSRGLQVVAALALAGVSAVNDSRSAATTMLMVALLVAWQAMRTGLRVRSGGVRVATQLGVLALVVFLGMQTLVLDGYLGADAQQRTEMQIQTSGSVFTGGRPEMGAATALVAARPWGYGAGAVPNLEDLLTAKTGMARLNYDPNNGYVEKYLFGSGFEVHSVLGDQWIRFGLAGMLFAVVCVVVVWRGTLADLGRNAASALLLYLALSCAWDLLFSPFYSVSATVLMLGVAIATPYTLPDRGSTVPVGSP